MNKPLLIVAPTISAEARRRVIEAVATHFATWPSLPTLHEIGRDESITEVVSQALAGGCDGVLAAGGDGTLAAVAHALSGGTVPMGIVPVGTGNMVARELGVPLEIGGAIALCAGAQRIRKIDAMVIAGRTFLLNAGVGVNAEAIGRTTRLGKNLLGRGAYAGTAFLEVLKSRKQRLEITVDGEAGVYDATDVLISNCGGLARALHPNGPEISADDGRLDVCIVSLKAPISYPWYYLGRHFFPRRASRIVRTLSARARVSVRSDTPLAVQADGDIIDTTPVTVEVRSAAVPIIVP